MIYKRSMVGTIAGDIKKEGQRKVKRCTPCRAEI
jgi:hypothetical protein